MAISKKSFVDIDLQGNSLNNSTVGANADMTKAGSFQYFSGNNRLQYFDTTDTQQIANLNDLNALSYTATIAPGDWIDNGNGAYYYEIIHNLGKPNTATSYLYDTISNVYNSAEFYLELSSPSLTYIYSNFVPSTNVQVNIVASGGNL